MPKCVTIQLPSLRRCMLIRTNFGRKTVTRNKWGNRLTVEKLAADSLDARELRRAGIFRDRWVTLKPSLRWPRIERMHVARYLIKLELYDQLVPQQIRVSWTRCHFGGARP